MIVEVKVPSPGESISEVEIATWLVEEGEYVEKDQELAEVESDKATLPLIAEEAGKIKIMAGHLCELGGIKNTHPIFYLSLCQSKIIMSVCKPC